MTRLFFITFFLVFILPGKAQWAQLNSEADVTFRACAFPSKNTGYVISDNNIRYTTNGGITWKWNKLTSSGVLLSVFFISDSVGWIGGGQISDGFILQTKDGGITWKNQKTKLNQIQSLCFINATNGWAVGNTNSNHFIYRTKDGGLTWTEQESSEGALRSVFFNSDSIGWAAGDNGLILTTTNGGRSWKITQNPKIAAHFTSIFSVSKLVAWVVGAYKYGSCYKTVDGGHTWFPQKIPTLAHLHSVYFTSKDKGWIAGDRGVILKTGDGGINWIVDPTMHDEDLYTICFPGSDRGFAAGDHGIIMKR